MPEDMEAAVAKVRAGYEAFNSGDFDAAVAWLHPEIVWNRVFEAEAPLHGREAVREFFNPEVFETQRTEVLDMEAIGEYVLVHGRFHGSFPASGLELAQDGYHLWRIRDGLAAEFRYFLDREEAVSAAES